MSLRAEFLPLTQTDKDNGVSLRAYLWDAEGRLEAIVSRMEPTKGRWGAKEPWFICSCWESDGLTVIRKHCEHIQHIEELIAHAEPGAAP